MTIKRRQFLGGAAAALAAASWPGWIRRAFADEPAPKAGEDCDLKVAETTKAMKALARGYKRATTAGKPLLVLVIPADDQAKWDRGQAFGELLNYGTPEQIAPLALAEVVAASMEDLGRLVPAAAGKGDPLMVLVDTQKVPATVHRFEAALAAHDNRGFDRIDGEPEPRPEDEVSAERIQTVARLVAAALIPSDAVIAVRADQVRAKLSKADSAQVERAIRDDGWLPAPLVDRSAAVILQASKLRRISDTKATALLADAVNKRLVAVPPDGAHWATGGGCGIDVEETPEEKAAREEREKHGEFDPVIGIGCGMGHVPEKARRMLYFYTVERPGLQ